LWTHKLVFDLVFSCSVDVSCVVAVYHALDNLIPWSVYPTDLLDQVCLIECCYRFQARNCCFGEEVREIVVLLVEFQRDCSPPVMWKSPASLRC